MSGTSYKVNCVLMQMQLLIAHMHLPGASVCAFFLAARQYFEVFWEIFGTVILLASGHGQVRLPASHNFHSESSFCETVWLMSWFCSELQACGVFICSEWGRTSGSDIKWNISQRAVKSPYCQSQHLLAAPGLLQLTLHRAGSQNIPFAFQLAFYPGCF